MFNVNCIVSLFDTVVNVLSFPEAGFVGNAWVKGRNIFEDAQKAKI